MRKQGMSKEAEESRKNLSIHPEWRKQKKQKIFDFPQEPKGIGREAFAHYCDFNRVQIEQRQEWDFSQLEQNELVTCRDYEMGREAVLLERFYRQRPQAKQRQPKAKRSSDSQEMSELDVKETKWLETRVAAIRTAWHLTEFTSSVPENPSWFIFPASRVLVLYREWPDVPYLKIDRDERLRRLQELSTTATNLTPAEVYRLKKEHLTNLEYLLDPLNRATGKKRVREIAIPECLNHEDLLKAFAAWLKVNFPEQGKGDDSMGSEVRKKHGTAYSKRQGRGSDKARVADDLNALAAHRLRRRAGLQRVKVIKLIKHLRACVYSSDKKLDRPLNRIQRRIHDFWEQTMSDLDPLAPLNLSQPDYTSLLQM